MQTFKQYINNILKYEHKWVNIFTYTFGHWDICIISGLGQLAKSKIYNAMQIIS